MTDKPTPGDAIAHTVTQAGGGALGWFAYSPTRQQWRSLTPGGALAYHASAREAELNLRSPLKPWVQTVTAPS